MRFRPPTMPMLVTAGYLVIVIPLLASMVFAEVTLQRLTWQTQTLLEEGIATAQVGIALRSELTDLERALMESAVLDNPSLLTVVESRWSQVHKSIYALGTLQWNSVLRLENKQLRNGFEQARKLWETQKSGKGDSQATVIKDVQSLGSITDAILTSSRQQVGADVKRLRTTTEQARWQIILSAVGLLPLGALMVWGIISVVTKPLKQLVDAISVLRKGDYLARISIPFPSEFRRAGQHLEWLRRRLARLEADKDRFLRHVSHELKTPLASLRGGTELLGEGALGELGPRQLEVVDIMDEASRELETLIENLLTYAEWRAKRQSAQDQWFNTRELIEEVLAAHRLPMAKHRLIPHVEVRAEVLFGRRSQLHTALDNLVTNAIKHAPPNSEVEIVVGDDDERFEISVRDWGSGVRDVEKNAIFEPFSRGAESEEQGVRGTGVGLAIVRETLQAHNGRVDVEDALPGARFRLNWPRPAA